MLIPYPQKQDLAFSGHDTGRRRDIRTICSCCSENPCHSNICINRSADTACVVFWLYHTEELSTELQALHQMRMVFNHKYS